MRTEVKWVVSTLILIIVLVAGGTAIALASMPGIPASETAAEEQQEMLAQKPVSGVTHIIIQHDALHPTAVIVPVGTVITWTNLDSSFHSVVIRATFVTASAPTQSPPLGPGDSFTYTFLQRGTFAYDCSLTSMSEREGEVVVT